MEVNNTMETEPMYGHPLKEVWLYPREATKQLKKYNLNRVIWVVLAFSAFAQVAQNGMFNTEQASSLGGLLVTAFVAAAIAPLLMIVCSWLIAGYMGWFGSEASTEDIWKISALSTMPSVVINFPSVVFLLLFLGADYVEPAYLLNEPNMGVALFLMALGLLNIVAAIWSLGIYFVALSEVSGLSTLKCVGVNVLLVALLILLMILII